MTSATSAVICNGFVFIPASSFMRDDRGDESLLPYEIQHEVPRPSNMPSLTIEQQQMLRMAYDSNSTPESRGGVDGIYLDIQTAIQWGLIPPDPLPGDVVQLPTPRPAPEPHPAPGQQSTINPQAAGMKPSATQAKKKSHRPNPMRPWDRRPWDRKLTLNPPWMG